MKRLIGLIAATLVCGLVVGACSSGKGVLAGGLPTSPASTDALMPTQPPVSFPDNALHPARRLGVHVSGKLRSMPWELVGIRRGGRVLVVYYVSGDGVRPYGVNNIGFRLIESSDSVELIAVSRDENPGPAEAGSLSTGIAEIVLSEPLGTRLLLHAPTSSGWSADLLAN